MKITVSFTLLCTHIMSYTHTHIMSYTHTCVPHPAATLIGLFRRFLSIWYTRVIYFVYCLNDSSITCFTLSRLRHAEPDIIRKKNLERMTGQVRRQTQHPFVQKWHALYLVYLRCVPSPLRKILNYYFLRIKIIVHHIRKCTSKMFIVRANLYKIYLRYSLK